MKYTRPVRTVVLLLLLLIVLFSPALARTAQSKMHQSVPPIEHTLPVIDAVSVAGPQHVKQTEIVLYQRVIAELVKTFYIA